jgi:hypothetical protein
MTSWTAYLHCHGTDLGSPRSVSALGVVKHTTGCV